MNFIFNPRRRLGQVFFQTKCFQPFPVAHQFLQPAGGQQQKTPPDGGVIKMFGTGLTVPAGVEVVPVLLEVFQHVVYVPGAEGA